MDLDEYINRLRGMRRCCNIQMHGLGGYWADTAARAVGKGQPRNGRIDIGNWIKKEEALGAARTAWGPNNMKNLINKLSR